MRVPYALRAWGIARGDALDPLRRARPRWPEAESAQGAGGRNVPAGFRRRPIMSRNPQAVFFPGSERHGSLATRTRTARGFVYCSPFKKRRRCRSEVLPLASSRKYDLLELIAVCEDSGGADQSLLPGSWSVPNSSWAASCLVAMAGKGEGPAIGDRPGHDVQLRGECGSTTAWRVIPDDQGNRTTPSYVAFSRH